MPPSSAFLEGRPAGAASRWAWLPAQRVRIESLTLGGVLVRQRRMVIADLGQLSELASPLLGLDGQDGLSSIARVFIEHSSFFGPPRSAGSGEASVSAALSGR